MSKHKFKVGDIVIGNEKADDYSPLRKGDVCKVLEVLNKYKYVVEHNKIRYWVYDDCFDLYEPNKPSKKNKVISLIEENKALKAENEHLKEVNEAVINYYATVHCPNCGVLCVKKIGKVTE